MTQEIGRGQYWVLYTGEDVTVVCMTKTVFIKVKIAAPKYVFGLKAEAGLYQILINDEGFPNVLFFGKNGYDDILVTNALGPNLEQLFTANDFKFNIKCVCRMAIQMLTRLEALHDQGLIHRDIRPENFLIGLNKKASTIFISGMDFCKHYRHAVTREHIPFREVTYKVGTMRYVKRCFVS